MELAKALDVRKGVTAIIGAGGKTTLLLALARELAQAARVIVTTTTHIYPPDGFPCLLQPGEAEIAAALEKHPCVCVGKPAKEGKITAADVPVRTLAELAEKTKRLKELNILLNMDEKDKTLMDDGPDEGEEMPERKVVGLER